VGRALQEARCREPLEKENTRQEEGSKEESSRKEEVIIINIYWRIK
jgi:hypothetical protein